MGFWVAGRRLPWVNRSPSPIVRKNAYPLARGRARAARAGAIGWGHWTPASAGVTSLIRVSLSKEEKQHDDEIAAGRGARVAAGAGVGRPSGSRANFSGAARAHRGAVPARRHLRHPRALDRPEAHRGMGPAGADGQPSGRGRQHRLRERGEIETRRLHAVHQHRRHARDQPGDLRQARVRSAQ